MSPARGGSVGGRTHVIGEVPRETVRWAESPLPPAEGRERVARPFDVTKRCQIDGHWFVPEAWWKEARKVALDALPSVAFVNHLATCSNGELLDFCKTQQGVRDIARATLGDEGFPDPLRASLALLVESYGLRGGRDDDLRPWQLQPEGPIAGLMRLLGMGE